ncbi:hypothetical protein [Weissella cibaria]|nr:hypothetical protein [Weissella cibaria]
MTQIEKVLNEYKIELDRHSAQLSALRAENEYLKVLIDELSKEGVNND